MPNVGDIEIMSASNFDGGRVSVFIEYEVLAVDANDQVTAVDPLRWAMVDDRPGSARSQYVAQVQPRANQMSASRSNLTWNSIKGGEKSRFGQVWLTLRWS